MPFCRTVCPRRMTRSTSCGWLTASSCPFTEQVCRADSSLPGVSHTDVGTLPSTRFLALNPTHTILPGPSCSPPVSTFLFTAVSTLLLTSSSHLYYLRVIYVSVQTHLLLFLFVLFLLCHRGVPSVPQWPGQGFPRLIHSGPQGGCRQGRQDCTHRLPGAALLGFSWPASNRDTVLLPRCVFMC